MAYERVIQTRYVSRGAEKLVKDQKRVSSSLKKQSNSLKKSAVAVGDWVERHKTAMVMMTAASTAMMYGIIQSSPALNASLASTRMAFSLLAYEIGESLTPAFNLMEEWTWKLYDAFMDLPKSVQNVISAFVLIIGIGIPAAAAIGGIVAAIGAIGAAGGIVIGVLIGFALVIASVVSIVDGFRNGLESAHYWIVGITSVIMPAIASILLLALGFTWLENKTGIFTKTFSYLWDTMKNVGRWIANVFVAIWEGLVSFLKNIWETIKVIIATAILFIYYLFTGQFDKMGKLFSVAWGKLKEIWGGALQAILAIVIWVKDKIVTGFWAAVHGIGIAIDWIVGAFWTFIAFMKELPGKILAGIKKLGTKEFWSDLLADIKNIGKKIVTSIVEGIGDIGTKIWNWVSEKITGFTSKIKNWAEGVLGLSPTLIQMGGSIVSSLISGIGDIGTKVWNAVKGGLSNIAGKFADWGSGAFDWGKDMLKNFGDGIKSAADKVKDTAKNVGGKIKDVFSFDLRENDKWAMRSGQDMLKHFHKGMERAQSSLDFGGMGPAAGLNQARPAGTSTTRTTVVNIGQISMSGDTASLGAGSRLGATAGDNIIERLRRR